MLRLRFVHQFDVLGLKIGLSQGSVYQLKVHHGMVRCA